VGAGNPNTLAFE